MVRRLGRSITAVPVCRWVPPLVSIRRHPAERAFLPPAGDQEGGACGAFRFPAPRPARRVERG